MDDVFVYPMEGEACAEADAEKAGLDDRLARCEQVLQENEALADEVLRTYEQLNLVFDVTAQVSMLTDPHQVKQLLSKQLRVSLNAQEVWCYGHYRPGEDFVCPDPQGFVDCPLPTDAEARVGDLVAAVRAEPKVIVQSQPAGCSQRPDARMYLMAGPLREGENQQPLVMCAVRCLNEFTSGDMLLFDSVLAFGGHVLRNLNLVERLKRTSFETVRALVSAIDKKDPYTCGHSERVGMLARMTGAEMGLSPEELQELEWAGLLHDIGKIGIPESILNKPGKLTNEEFAVIKQHPQMSYEVLKPIEALTQVMRTVVEHHENNDGTGYPRGLRGEEISLPGRIMHVVDVFDALTSNRAYRTAFNAEKALAILREDAGTKLDPAVVEHFTKVLAYIEQHRPVEFKELFAASSQEARS